MDNPEPTTMVEALWHWAERTPQALAYASAEQQLTYGQLRTEACGWAAALAARGLRPGGRCALLLPTGLDFIRGLFAVQTLNAAPLAINPELPPNTLLERLRASRCDLALVPASFPFQDVTDAANQVPLAIVAELPGSALDPLPQPYWPSAEDPALLQATSGTSGEPRTAVILHRNLLASAHATGNRLQIRPDDVLVNWVPLYHSLGLIRFIMGGLIFGRPVYLVPPGVAYVRTWLTTIARTRGTITGAPDFGYRIAAQLVSPEGLDLSSLRYAMNSGEPIRLHTIRSFEERFGVPGAIRPGYGLAEANGVTYFAPDEPLRQDAQGNLACGRPAEGMTVEIVDEQDRPQPATLSGEIRLRGPQVFAGYLDDEPATQEKIRDGWLYSGDVGCLDADGFLFVQGRKRALIKRGGAAIAPGIVEEAAERIATVRRAAAIGVDSPSLAGSEELVLVAELEDLPAPGADLGPLAEAIVTAASQALGFAPSEVILVAPQTIPCTANGKVRHGELKQWLASGELRRRGAILFGGSRG